MNGYTTSSCLYNLHHPIEPSKLPFNWIHILDSQIFFDALCICAAQTWDGLRPCSLWSGRDPANQLIRLMEWLMKLYAMMMFYFYS